MLKPADPFDLIRWLACSQSDPRKAVAELVQNSIDARARRVLIERRRVRRTPALAIRDDGEDVWPELAREEALRTIATNIGCSRKRNLTPLERQAQVVAGKYGIGLLGFWSLGRRMDIRSRVNGSEVFVLRLREDEERAEIFRDRMAMESEATFTDVVITDVHEAAARVLSGRRLGDYVSAELRGPLLLAGTDVSIHDGLARGTSAKRFAVVPRRYTGEPLNVAASELTLEQALHQARKNNRTVLASRARLEQARTSLGLAWAALFPVATAQGKYTRNNVEVSFPLPAQPGGPTETVTIQPANQLDGFFNFTAPLVAPPAYAALKASKVGFRAAQADQEISLNEVLYAVAQAFYAAAIADEMLVARQSSIEVARATAQLAETRYSVGAVTKTDVSRAQLALVRAEQAERETRFAREQTYRALATLIQAQGELTVKPGTPHARPPEIPALDTALSLRPEFRALELTSTSLALQSRAFAWRWSPTLSAFGNLHLFNYDGFARKRYTWALGLALDWVIYDGGIRDAQRRQADAQARETRLRSEILRDAIRDDLANQRSLLETKRHAHDAAERQVALAEETLGLVRTQYQAGSVAEIDLLRAQDDLTAAKEALAQSHLEVALADLALQRAAGSFPGDAGRL